VSSVCCKPADKPINYGLAQPICDLNRIFGGAAARVPDGPPDTQDFVFHGGVLPVPPVTLSTNRILFRKLHNTYNSWHRADSLWMYLSPQTCRELGVFLLACAFHGPSENTILTLNNQKSEVQRIIIAADKRTLGDVPNGLSTVPFAFRYWPAETKRFPFVDDCCVHDLPLLALSNLDNSVGPTEEQWRSRESVWMWAGQTGTIRFAELLLNAGCSWNPVREYALEGDAGYRSVAPLSAELRIFLPGSDGWPYDGDNITDEL
jgi:hypothetical protein